MQKLKQKKINHFNLLDYKPFLKNNNLKKNKFKLKKNLFENSIFLKDTDLIWIELNKSKSIFLPNFNLNLKQNSILYTIQTQYENHFLFNYSLNYPILYYFTKLIFQNYLKKKRIKGRMIKISNYKKKEFFISFFGLILKMKLKNAHKNKRFFKGRKKKIQRNFSSYKLKYLNFNIDQNFFKKSILSRKTYVQEIIEKEKNFKKKKKKNMPQFDQFSFFNQVSWFFFFFLNFYFFITYFFLPKICYNIKFRKKKIVFDNQKKNQIHFEKNNIIFFFNNSYKTFCSNFESFIIKKISIYKKNEFAQIQQQPLLNKGLTNEINIFLNKKFLLFQKILMNI